MRKGQLLYIWLVISLSCASLHGGLSSLADDILMSNKVRIVAVDRKVSEQRRDVLLLEYDQLKADDEKLEEKKREVKDLATQSKHALRRVSSEFESQRLSWLNKYEQLLLDMSDAREQSAAIVKQHIDYIEKFLKNDALEQKGSQKSVYSFDDLHNLTKKIIQKDDTLYDLQSKKEDAEGAIDRLNAVILGYERQLKDANQKIADIKDRAGDIKDDIALVDLEKEYIDWGKKLAALEIEKNKLTIQFIESRMDIAQSELQILKENLQPVRMNLRIDQSDVLVYESKYHSLKNEVQSRKSDLITERNDLILEKRKSQEELDNFIDKLEGYQTTLQQLDQWDIQEEDLEIIADVCQSSLLKASIHTIDRKLDRVQAAISLEDAKIAQAKNEFRVIGSLFSITQSQFKDNELNEAERNVYKELQNGLIAELKIHKEHIASAHAYIKNQHKALSNIKRLKDRIESQYVSRADHKMVSEILHIIRLAESRFADQNSLAVKLSELYTQVMTIHEETMGTVDFIVKEFDFMGVWHRSNRAITWKGIKLVVPNLILFARNVKSVLITYFMSFTYDNIVSYVKSIQPPVVFSFLFILLLLFVLFVLLQTLISYFDTIFKRAIEDNSRSFFVHLASVLFGFLHYHFLGLYSWMGAWLFAMRYKFSVALLILLYAASIALIIYYSRLFLLYFVDRNRKLEHFLLSKRFESRFSFIFSFFTVSTAGILFLRKLFMLVMVYQQSEFPTILLRLYHVVIFVSIVFSIDKEELLHLIPKKGFIAEHISEFINRYYSMILGVSLCLLIISDPYLGGYGSLVWHVVFNSVLTVLFVLAMFFIHRFIKRYSTFIFFKDDDEYESSMERFEYAKTWYAVYAVALFAAYVLATVLVCSKIWSYGITYEKFMDVMHYGVFKIEYVVDKSGKVIENFLTIAGMLRILFISLSGILLAYLFNHFILKRIFAIQYVDPGVQNAVTTISRYFIIISMILIAFARADLGHVVGYVLAIVLVTFGWSFKDLFTDVVAYFFILVQRPIKLGDYVKLDGETMGVVRKISPRAVILRRKNSVTIVVPNSRVLKTALYNWNYTRSFLAFEDITFSVPFTANVIEVKDILMSILDEHPDVLKVPESVVRLDDFGDKGYVFLVRGFLSFSNTLNQWDIRSNIRFKIVEELAKKGVTVAEPVLRVNMKEQDNKNLQK